jgi:hypothetical protein
MPGVDYRRLVVAAALIVSLPAFGAPAFGAKAAAGSHGDIAVQAGSLVDGTGGP